MENRTKKAPLWRKGGFGYAAEGREGELRRENELTNQCRNTASEEVRETAEANVFGKGSWRERTLFILYYTGLKIKWV